MGKVDTGSALSENITTDIPALVGSKGFSKLDANIQKNLIDSVTTLKQIESGKMGKLLGTKMPNMAVYSAFLLCRYLLIFAGFAMFISCICCEPFNLELIKIIIPVFTMSLGYMFGKADNGGNKGNDG